MLKYEASLSGMCDVPSGGAHNHRRKAVDAVRDSCLQPSTFAFAGTFAGTLSEQDRNIGFALRYSDRTIRHLSEMYT